MRVVVDTVNSEGQSQRTAVAGATPAAAVRPSDLLAIAPDTEHRFGTVTVEREQWQPDGDDGTPARGYLQDSFTVRTPRRVSIFQTAPYRPGEFDEYTLYRSAEDAANLVRRTA